MTGPFNPEALVAEALGWCGTPFHHQARLKGVGVDCVGVAVCAAKVCGLAPGYQDRTDYARQPDGSMERLLGQHLVQVPKSARRGGDVVFFYWAKFGQHLGILTDPDHVVHAYQPAGKVVLTPLTGPHLKAARRIYRFPEFIPNPADWQE